MPEIYFLFPYFKNDATEKHDFSNYHCEWAGKHYYQLLKLNYTVKSVVSNLTCESLLLRHYIVILY